MTALSIFYKLLGAVFIVLGVSCVAEKYRTVRGARCCPARILRCEKAGPNAGPGAGKARGGWHYVVEIQMDGGVVNCPTNDAFWFDHSHKAGSMILVWFNPEKPQLVERKSPEAELLCALFAALGLAAMLL